jgi:hypothetical protein
MELTRYIDVYCERTDPSLWAEPLNAITNLAFFAAAWFGWREARRLAEAGRPAADLRVLAALAALVGAGSLAFHTTARVWAAWADGLAILAFIYAYLACYLRRVARLSAFGVAAGLGVYFLLDRLAPRLFAADVLNGSGQYLAALVALGGLALHARLRVPEAGAWLAAAAGLFAVSLVLRTVDRDVCASLPIGTHFAWHVLNGGVLALALGGLARADRRSERAKPSTGG